MPAAVWVVDLSVCPKPPQGVPIPLRFRQDRRDSGVTAVVRGGTPRVLSSALGVPLSLRGPGKTGGTRHDRRCVREGPLRVPSQPPWGDPIPARPRQDRRDWGVTSAVWGRDLPVCHPKPPTGRPYPSMARAGPGGPGCNRRFMGGDFLVCPEYLHGASLSPRGPGRTGRT